MVAEHVIGTLRARRRAVFASSFKPESEIGEVIALDN
jgi:hypothetical protein